MNVELIHPKSKVIVLGKQYRGTWLLAGIDLLIVLVLWAAVAYTSSGSKPVAAQPLRPAQIGSAADAQSMPARSGVVPILRASQAARNHGAACDELPAGCDGKIQPRAIVPAIPCQPVSRAAQHRNGDLENPNPCPEMR